MPVVTGFAATGMAPESPWTSTPARRRWTTRSPRPTDTADSAPASAAERNVADQVGLTPKRFARHTRQPDVATRPAQLMP